MQREDGADGSSQGESTAAGEPADRWNWDSPLMISPHSPTRLYYASQRLYRSDDRGNSWTAISPDLSRGLDRDRLLAFLDDEITDALSYHLRDQGW